jgi:hypothetical protein
MDPGEEKLPPKSKKKPSRKRTPAATKPNAWPALKTAVGAVITAVSATVAVLTFYVSANPWGQVSIVDEPMGFGIMRGVQINADESVPGIIDPSDCVYMPLDWFNNTGGTVLAKDPTLVFSELGKKGKLTDENLRFQMVGRLPSVSFGDLQELNTGVSSKTFTYANSVLIESRSVAQSVGIFRPQNGRNLPTQGFRFQGGDSYRIEIEFERYPAPPVSRTNESSALVFKKITFPSSVEYLSLYGGNGGWDYFTYAPGSRLWRASQ